MPVTLVKSSWVSGNLIFKNAAGNTVLAIRNDGGVEVVTATPRTLTEVDNGKTFIVAVADCVFNLPATFVGGRFTFIVKTLSAVTGCAISPVAADYIAGPSLTGVVDKDLINTAATDALGDSVTLVADGVDGWFVESINGTWAKQG